MSNATNELMSEHRAIERVIGLLERASERMERGEQLPPAILAKAHGFLSEFVDKCHHAKEEGALFPAMAKNGVPTEGGPIGVMLMEHDEGRRYVAALGEALPGYAQGDPKAVAAVATNIRRYAQLLRAHIQKEDNVLYPLSDRVLSAGDKHGLEDEFARIEREVTGPGEHEKHLALIQELEAAAG